MTTIHHHKESFIRQWVFSVDHKIIALQYFFTSLFFLFIGFIMILLIRWQLAYPGNPLPYLEHFLPTSFAPGGTLTPASYNALGAMHGTIMIFLGIVPLSVGAFGNYFLPLQIGAKDMAFPFVNMLSYWNYFVGGLLMLLSFILPGGAAQSGWTSYVPLAVINPGQTVWLIAMTFLITSSLLGAINFLVTTINMRAPGMSWSRLPLFVWAQFITALLLLFAFPVLQGGAILQLLDRLANTSFYMPKDLIVGGAPITGSGGGSVLLWQHLFWFLAHPEVYVLLLPSMGIVADILANGTRKPIFGYKEIAGSFCFIAVLSFVVWAHHMFVSGMKTSLSYLFMTTTLVISIPSVAILTCLLLSLKGASIRFTVPMLFVLAFLPMFGIGGLTGLPLGFAPSDIYLHDTYYVIGHFHYIVVTGVMMVLMGAIYYWFPKMFGRKMNTFWGKIHFWGTLLSTNGIFFPMFIQGLAGVQRRLFDPTVQAHNLMVQPSNVFMTYSAIILLLFQIPFILNFFLSLFRGEKTQENPWHATTLEWACPSPPIPHQNFEKAPTVYRGPYEYSVPGRTQDYWPQDQKE